MKASRRGFRPRAEGLEARDCPSLTLSYVSSALSIRGTPTAALTVTGQGAAGSNIFQVKDGTSILGTYSICRDLVIQIASRPGGIDIDLNNRAIGGNVLIDLGNGLTAAPSPANTVDIFDSTSGATRSGGTIRGNLTVLHGNGRETIDVGARRQAAAPTYADLPITVRGNLNVVGRESGNLSDTLQVGEGTAVRGSASIVDIDNVSIGLQSSTVTDVTTMSGDVSIMTAGVSTGLSANLLGNFGRNVIVNAVATTARFNNCTLEPVAANVNSVVAGNLAVTLGQAGLGNRFNLLHGGSGTESSVVGGSVTLTSTSGAGTLPDVFNIDADINGSLNVNMGEGTNNLLFNAQQPANPNDAGPSVGGSMTVTAGNGTNNIGVTATGLFAGTVAGNLSFYLGNGDNGMAGDPMTVTTGLGGKLLWRSGNGQNFLTLGDGSQDFFYNVDVVFGNDDDTFETNLGTNGALNGRVDGGGRLTGNTFTQTSGNLAPTLVVLNFP
jgi:hypothetical protein